MEEIVLFIHAQGGLTRIGLITLRTWNVEIPDDYQMEPRALLTLEDVKSICWQHRQAPEAKFGQVRDFEWQESQPAAARR